MIGLADKNASGESSRPVVVKKPQLSISQEGVEYIDNAAFRDRDAERRLWNGDEIQSPRYRVHAIVDDADSPFVSDAAPSRLTLKQEQMLFLRYNYAKRRLAKAMHAGDRREVRRWSQLARMAQEQLVHANLPLVCSMARRIHAPGVCFTELLSDGQMSLLRSVEKFDVSRGFRFSTYACHAILAGFHRLVSRTRTRMRWFPVSYEPQMDRTDFGDKRDASQREDAVDAVRMVLHRNLAELSPMELEVVHARYMRRTEGRPCPLAEVGRQLGLSRERVRQIERAGLVKLRQAIDEHLAV